MYTLIAHCCCFWIQLNFPCRQLLMCPSFSAFSLLPCVCSWGSSVQWLLIDFKLNLGTGREICSLICSLSLSLSLLDALEDPLSMQSFAGERCMCVISVSLPLFLLEASNVTHFSSWKRGHCICFSRSFSFAPTHTLYTQCVLLELEVSSYTNSHFVNQGFTWHWADATFVTYFFPLLSSHFCPSRSYSESHLLSLSLILPLPALST